ncbi:hypothetical protein [Streptomyces acidiscabies]|uniref:Chaplin domain-containing protein n=2 Tax=Streptomyces acidiscabies TaxID=42234 RepID=A0AAP6EKJ2_9ACTN|nr:hypothetical protein [Streptomyces acidiscabies]MBP5937224.1 hypothetical protein [Streptomyces sp. LBUM 1476]MBZ3914723.1 hypothetical protein [Streptomyces acidiscabies]MDX2966124.1 hypothetical protein [Streptomyces acidiscabies]MDX3020637.1 hypothetical protein [Streptomyces acidiscabies]MDX3795844.1 hypothetical protein [Streptomyces acidiscabies]
MKKIVTAVLPLAALALAGAPAHADTGPLSAADNWNFAAGVVCHQELAVVPALGDMVGDHVNNCADGNVVSPPSGT